MTIKKSKLENLFLSYKRFWLKIIQTIMMMILLSGCESNEQKIKNLEERKVEITGGYYLYQSIAYDYAKKVLSESDKTIVHRLNDSVQKYSQLKEEYENKLKSIESEIDSLKK